MENYPTEQCIKTRSSVLSQNTLQNYIENITINITMTNKENNEIYFNIELNELNTFVHHALHRVAEWKSVARHAEWDSV